jgi:MoxR-like ATPase
VELWAAAPEELEELEPLLEPLAGPVPGAGIAVAPEVGELIDLLLGFGNVVVEGVPGTGKSYVVRLLEQEWPNRTGRHLVVHTTVLHPATSYEEFVGGVRPVRVEGKYVFAPAAGWFLRHIDTALKNPAEDHLLVLDELNRANIPKVLGDLLLVMDWSKRLLPAAGVYDVAGAGPDQRVELPQLGTTLVAPDNVFLLGTMNTSDRSIAPIDAALRRRFSFFRLDPWPVQRVVDHLQERRDPLPQLVQQSVGWWAEINAALEAKLGPDAVLGQSYMLELAEGMGTTADPAGEEAVFAHCERVWRYRILPQLFDTLFAHDALDELAEAKPVGQALGGAEGALKLKVTVAGEGLGRAPLVGPAEEPGPEPEPEEQPHPDPIPPEPPVDDPPPGPDA